MSCVETAACCTFTTAYEYFTYGSAEFFADQSRAPATHDFALSFSKGYGMASWRVAIWCCRSAVGRRQQDPGHHPRVSAGDFAARGHGGRSCRPRLRPSRREGSVACARSSIRADA
jgi:hypothetical protein